MANMKLIILYIIVSIHSDGLLVAKKFDILKPLVAQTCNRSSVGINICVQLSVAINPVSRYRLVATPLIATYTSVPIKL